MSRSVNHCPHYCAKAAIRKCPGDQLGSITLQTRARSLFDNFFNCSIEAAHKQVSEGAHALETSSYRKEAEGKGHLIVNLLATCLDL